MIKLRKVGEKDCRFLYKLLLDRPRQANISHVKMPHYASHCRFVLNEPYFDWRIIWDGHKKIGSIYLSKHNEIGIAIDQKYKRSGYATLALLKFVNLHKNTGAKVYANINPKNKASVELFKSLGFEECQTTYSLIPKTW